MRTFILVCTLNRTCSQIAMLALVNPLHDHRFLDHRHACRAHMPVLDSVVGFSRYSIDYSKS